MTTLALSGRAAKITPPTDDEGLRGMFRDARVLITAIIVGGLVVAALFVTLAVLSLNGADAAQIMAVVSLILNAVLLGRLEFTRAKVDSVQQQTNGTQSKLIEAAIQSQPPRPTSEQ